MRHSRAETAETRQRIVQTAARQFRKHGFSGIGIADIMAQAGLTHGGFYKHFDSKEALAAEACSWALAASREGMAKVVADAPPGEGLRAVVDWYLSMLHRDNAERGCVIAALASEAARLDSETRDSIATGFQALAEVIATLLDGSASDVARESRMIVATMIGTLMAARTIDDRAIVEELLQDARELILRGQKGLSPKETL